MRMGFSIHAEWTKIPRIRKPSKRQQSFITQEKRQEKCLYLPCSLHISDFELTQRSLYISCCFIHCNDCLRQSIFISYPPHVCNGIWHTWLGSVNSGGCVDFFHTNCNFAKRKKHFFTAALQYVLHHLYCGCDVCVTAWGLCTQTVALLAFDMQFCCCELSVWPPPIWDWIPCSCNL